MVQKCSYLKTLEIFFKEPTEIHFIKEISKKTKIAPTSIRNNIKHLLKEKLIIPKESKPFSGYIANRENKQFIFAKRSYNLSSLEKLKYYLEENLFPKLLILFGSYSIGEDIENSDIDIFILSKTKKINLSKFEKELEKEINLLITDKLNKLEKPILNKIYNGIVLSGGFDG
jgi:predicted nucleotidyltransferase